MCVGGGGGACLLLFRGVHFCFVLFGCFLLFLFLRACVRACLPACVRACVRACVCACVCVCVCVCVCYEVSECVCYEVSECVFLLNLYFLSYSVLSLFLLVYAPWAVKIFR